jgi:hypothetical protein
VDGVAPIPGGVEVAVVGRFGPPVAAIAAQARAAVLAAEPGIGVVDVRVDDLALVEPDPAPALKVGKPKAGKPKPKKRKKERKNPGGGARSGSGTGSRAAQP